MENDIAPWMTLKAVNGVGNILIKRLTDEFGSPENIFNASLKELCKIEGVTLNKALNIKKIREPAFVKEEIKTALKEDIKIIHLKHKDYPALLKEIPDPPPFLYLRGNHPRDIVSFAIVGSRKASMEGRSKASKISRYLSSKGIRIVSGMALGIDGAAHNASLNSSGGTTAVLGSGLLNIYPREHRALYKKIIENGGVISEFPLNEKPGRFNFPARNRIISGISIGLLVVEAMEKSGALITADLAADQGKDVFTIKLSTTKSPGTEKLNSFGTKVIESGSDIISEYPWMDNKKNNIKNEKKSLDFNEKIVIKALSQSGEPLHIDELCGLCGNIPAGEISAIIVKLELKGIIDQLPGKFFYLIEDEN